MQKVITTTTIPKRTWRKALGLSSGALVYLDIDNTLFTPTERGTKSFGQKTLSRRLGVKATGAELGFSETGALVLTHTETNADLYA